MNIRDERYLARGNITQLMESLRLRPHNDLVINRNVFSNGQFPSDFRRLYHYV